MKSPRKSSTPFSLLSSFLFSGRNVLRFFLHRLPNVFLHRPLILWLFLCRVGVRSSDHPLSTCCFPCGPARWALSRASLQPQDVTQHVGTSISVASPRIVFVNIDRSPHNLGTDVLGHMVFEPPIEHQADVLLLCLLLRLLLRFRRASRACTSGHPGRRSSGSLRIPSWQTLRCLGAALSPCHESDGARTERPLRTQSAVPRFS